MSIQIVLTTTGTHNWTVPSNWNNANNSIEVIGGGGGGASNGSSRGGGGGGGGGYGKISNVTLTPGASISYTIDPGGGTDTSAGDTYFNGASFAAAPVAAHGGTAGSTSGTGGPGGTGKGTVTFTGGTGGGSGVYDPVGGGGGGAAGPNANGVNASGHNGGQGDGTFGGTGGSAGGVNNPGNPGNPGTEYGSSPNYGSGGGGGGGNSSGIGGNGGNYGAGGGGGGFVGGETGGSGTQGIIIITYTLPVSYTLIADTGSLSLTGNSASIVVLKGGSSKLPATITNSDYKWLTQSLKTSQLGPAYTPYFSLKIVDDTLNPNAILSSPNKPVLGEAMTAPDGSILMAGGDGSGNLRFWKLTDASQSMPTGTTLVASGAGYASTLNTSIAVSNWINGSYVIDIYYYSLVSGITYTLNHKRSFDGGTTWTTSYTINATNDTSTNKYVAAGTPVYNPATNTVLATVFYIKGNQGASSAFYKIFYQQWIVGAVFGAETAWSRAVDSQDWTLHSLEAQYLNGSWYIFFSGYHNWYDTPSGNNNYNIYMARLDNITSSATTDAWQLVREIFVSSSPQVTNNNSCTFPKISTDGSLFYLVFKAVVGEGLQTAGTGTNQIGTISNNYYYMMQSADLTNFTYPIPLCFTDGTFYTDTAGVGLISQNQYYYLLGNGQRWQYLRNNIVANVTDWVIAYEIQELSGASSQISITLGNANNQWIGSSPIGVGALAIAVNRKIILEQGYVTSVGNEIVPRNIFYIDTITLESSASNNTATITGRDTSRHLQIVSTKFSYTNNGPFYYNDLFDGTALQNWSVISGTWREVTGNNLEVYNGGGVISQPQLSNKQESSVIFTILQAPTIEDGQSVHIYPMYQDSDNYLVVNFTNSGNTSIYTTIELKIGGSVVHTWDNYITALATGRMPVMIKRYNYYTYDIIYGTPNNSGIGYTDDAFNNSPGSPYYPFHVIEGIAIDTYFTSSVFLVDGAVALGSKNSSGSVDFQVFKYLQLGHSLSLQEALEYLCTISGITNYKRSTAFTDSTYNSSNYLGNYTVSNGVMVVGPLQVVSNLNYQIANGEIGFTAVVEPISGVGCGFNLFFRASNSGGGNAYYLKIARSTSGLVFAELYIIVSGVSYFVVSTTSGTLNPLPIDITKLNNYRIVMIDQLIYLFINDRCYLMWQDTNFTINSAQFSNGFWMMEAISNSVLGIMDFVSYTLYNQINNISINPGDDMSSIVQNVLEIAYAYSYTDQFGRLIGITLNQTDLSNYTYQNLLYKLQAQVATQATINEVVVTGNGVVATQKDPVLIAQMGQVRSLNITDYTILTYEDALNRAQKELINVNRLNAQNNPAQPMNVGAELFDVVTLINTGSNSTSVSGNFRVYNQTFVNDGAKGQYSIQLETGTL